MCRWAKISLVLIWFSFSVSGAFAHKLNLFAWVEGGKIAGQAYFTGGEKPAGATVEMFDSRQKKVGESRTDAAGNFVLPISEIDDLTLRMALPDGHAGQYLLKKAELAGQGSAASEPALPPMSAPSTEPVASSSALSPAEEAALDQLLDRKLAPIHAKLAEISQEHITVQSIITGIGFILGLFGAAALGYRRGKQ